MSVADKKRVYSRRSINMLLEADQKQLAEVPENWATTHGFVYRTDTGKLVTMCDIPAVLAKQWNGEADPKRNFAIARMIVHSKQALARNAAIISQLLNEIDALKELVPGDRL